MFTDEFVNQLADAVAERIIPAISRQPRLMTVAETGTYIGRSKRAVEHMIERGLIPTIRLDNRVQVDREALDKLISDRPSLLKHVR